MLTRIVNFSIKKIKISTFADVKPGMNYVMKGFIEANEYKSNLFMILEMTSQKWFDHDVPT